MLENKNIIVTGSNRGIGKSMIELFAANGANIWAHAREETPQFIDFIQETSEKNGVNIMPVYCEMSDSLAIKECVKEILSSKIKIDALINNAGIAHGGLFQMTPIDDIRHIFDINLFAVMEFTQRILRTMIRQKGGAIVNISSIAGINLDSGNCAYGTSKAALIAFSKTLSSEVAPMGIRVNSIAPGLIDTDMATLMERKSGISMIEETAMNRLGKPVEIAELAMFLASDKSSFITGQVIPCDGGTK